MSKKFKFSSCDVHEYLQHSAANNTTYSKLAIHAALQDTRNGLRNIAWIDNSILTSNSRESLAENQIETHMSFILNGVLGMEMQADAVDDFFITLDQLSDEEIKRDSCPKKKKRKDIKKRIQVLREELINISIERVFTVCSSGVCRTRADKDRSFMVRMEKYFKEK